MTINRAALRFKSFSWIEGYEQLMSCLLYIAFGLTSIQSHCPNNYLFINVPQTQSWKELSYCFPVIIHIFLTQQYVFICCFYVFDQCNTYLCFRFVLFWDGVTKDIQETDIFSWSWRVPKYLRPKQMWVGGGWVIQRNDSWLTNTHQPIHTWILRSAEQDKSR